MYCYVNSEYNGQSKESPQAGPPEACIKYDVYVVMTLCAP